MEVVIVPVLVSVTALAAAVHVLGRPRLVLPLALAVVRVEIGWVRMELRFWCYS